MLKRLILATALAAGLASLASPASAQVPQVVQVCGATSGVVAAPGPGGRLTVDVNGNLCVTGGGSGGGSGSSPSSPTYTAPAGANITRISCTLPAYSAGGNAVCTDSAGVQTTTACAANAACLIAAANASRKYAFASNATAGASISLGYTATVAPGNSRSLDGPSAAGGQGGFYEWASPPTNAIYAATATANAVLVFEQGQ